ncbi:DUF2523 domain-containing protein, partial [Acinetobacter baumannii]|nr:DUF2523 domain-containing protein [Acinetobacter baumannii]
MPLFIGAIVAALLKVLFRYAVFKIFAKLILGTATAGIIYLFLTSTIKPFIDEMQQKIVDKAAELSTIGGTAAEVIQYFDFIQCVNIMLSASAACFSWKLLSAAIRAFGMNTGG